MDNQPSVPADGRRYAANPNCKMNFVAIDFETANETRDSACAVGLTQVCNGIALDPVYLLLRPPELRFAHWNIRVHGISPDDVVDAPTFADAWPQISALIDGQLVVAHNASFDMSVLRHSLYSLGIPVPQLSYLCSLNLARRAWPKFVSHSLGFLAQTQGIELEHHHAGSDSRASAELVLLAGRELGLNCPRELSQSLDVTIGEVFSNDYWTPSSAPSLKRDIESIEIALPDGYNVQNHPFYDMSIVFTGTLKMFGRNEAERIVTLLGGHPKRSVSKKTNYVVMGVQDARQLAQGKTQTSKLAKAFELRDAGVDIQIITDKDFTELVFSPSNNEIGNDDLAK